MVHSISRRVGNFTRPCRDGNPVGNGGGGRGASGVDVRDLGRVARVVSQAKGVGSRPFRALVFCLGGTWGVAPVYRILPLWDGKMVAKREGAGRESGVSGGGAKGFWEGAWSEGGG
jgi:hypothetical protein